MWPISIVRRYGSYKAVVIFRSSSSISRYDLLAESLAHQGPSQRRPKVVLDAYSETGFDVLNLLHFPQSTAIHTPISLQNHSLSSVEPRNIMNDKHNYTANMIHLKGSIIVFPYSCFLWGVRQVQDVTTESLAAVALHKPPIQYLFIGSNMPFESTQFSNIRKQFKEQFNIIVEMQDLTNAMGTFNILNGEDRRVAAALVVPVYEET